MATNSREAQQRAEEKRRGTRARAWSFIAYPDSAPADWVERLNELHVRCAISPLHDRDVNDDGTPKKPHWHVLLDFDSVKTCEQVDEIARRANGTRPEQVNSLKGYARYLTHMDDPEKAQYDAADVRCLAGFDMGEATAPTSTDRYRLINEMRQFVKEQGIIELSDLMDYAADHRFDDWFPLLCDNSAVVMNMYIRSMRHQCRDRGQWVPVEEERPEELSADPLDGPSDRPLDGELPVSEGSTEVPSIEEVRSYAESVIGMDGDDAYCWYNSHAAAGWVDGSGIPIGDWRKALEGHAERLRRLERTGPTLDEVVGWAKEAYGGMVTGQGEEASEFAMFWYIDMKDSAGTIPEDWRERIEALIRGL